MKVKMKKNIINKKIVEFIVINEQIGEIKKIMKIIRKEL